jgi:hypothetical protein
VREHAKAFRGSGSPEAAIEAGEIRCADEQGGTKVSSIEASQTMPLDEALHRE